jgi:hypothetical protein
MKNVSEQYDMWVGGDGCHDVIDIWWTSYREIAQGHQAKLSGTLYVVLVDGDDLWYLDPDFETVEWKASAIASQLAFTPVEIWVSEDYRFFRKSKVQYRQHPMYDVQ